jgi:hypothetical protein
VLQKDTLQLSLAVSTIPGQTRSKQDVSGEFPPSYASEPRTVAPPQSMKPGPTPKRPQCDIVFNEVLYDSPAEEAEFWSFREDDVRWRV